MAEFVIPSAVTQLVHDCIDSLEQLETVLLLRARREEEWTAEAVAVELRTSPASAAESLAKLCARNLIASSSATTYRYTGSAQDQAVAELDKVYRQARFRVLDLIYSKPSDRVRSFADAFKIGKDKRG